jgi:hypothetical protein
LPRAFASILRSRLRLRLSSNPPPVAAPLAPAPGGLARPPLSVAGACHRQAAGRYGPDFAQPAWRSPKQRPFRSSILREFCKSRPELDASTLTTDATPLAVALCGTPRPTAMAAGIQTPNVARFTWRRVAPAHATKSLRRSSRGKCIQNEFLLFVCTNFTKACARQHLTQRILNYQCSASRRKAS